MRINFSPGDHVVYMDEITNKWKESHYKKFAYGRHFLNDGSEIFYNYHIFLFNDNAKKLL